MQGKYEICNESSEGTLATEIPLNRMKNAFSLS